MGLTDAMILAAMLSAAFTVGGALQKWFDRRDSAQQVDRVIDAAVERERVMDEATHSSSASPQSREAQLDPQD